MHAGAHPIFYDVDSACSFTPPIACAAGSSCPSLVANVSNGYTVVYGVSLGARPLRGAVWLDFALSSSSAQGVDGTFTPSHLVFYQETWDEVKHVSLHVTLSNLSASSASILPVLVIEHRATACDTAFLLHPELSSLSEVTVAVLLPNTDGWSTGAYLAAVGGGVSATLLLLLVIALRYKHKPRAVLWLRATSAPPELTLAPDVRYHGFLSHSP